MRINVTDEKLPGVRVIEHEPFTDHRGFFYESYSRVRSPPRSVST